MLSFSPENRKNVKIQNAQTLQNQHQKLVNLNLKSNAKLNI